MFGKTEQERYEETAAMLRRFVAEDDDPGHRVPARRRVNAANRAVNLAELQLSRLDPVLHEVRLRYAEALDAAGAHARHLRDHLGTAVREASVLLGPDDPVLVARLRAVQRAEQPIGGARAARRIERAQQEAASLHDGGGAPYVLAVLDLADRHRAAGGHARFTALLEGLIGERRRLGLDADQRHWFAQLLGGMLHDAGEVALALPLLEEARKRPRADDAWEREYLNLTAAQCLLANGRDAAAEALLRRSLSALADPGRDRSLARLRYRAVHELGTALFCQDRFPEALERFREACDLLAADPRPHERTFRAYRNARVHAAIAVRDGA
ncbi:tetratricopeptide repeat protein [Glycomyces terrestris]|uniref:Tetratricopeptide repeat protein n=1 Tax=Glycomyces terrestris TaxID=2493553 RepID=A0A426UVE5_9ACTN|nr:hypothetical protein [Glycomyces terrestris]RRR98290.1 hypothetical protein EIW28_15370 [Glycomyces terrestris]